MNPIRVIKGPAHMNHVGLPCYQAVDEAGNPIQPGWVWINREFLFSAVQRSEGLEITTGGGVSYLILGAQVLGDFYSS